MESTRLRRLGGGWGLTWTPLSGLSAQRPAGVDETQDGTDGEPARLFHFLGCPPRSLRPPPPLPPSLSRSLPPLCLPLPPLSITAHLETSFHSEKKYRLWSQNTQNLPKTFSLGQSTSHFELLSPICGKDMTPYMSIF